MDWPEVRVWRKAKRVELIEARRALPIELHREYSAVIEGQLDERFDDLAGKRVGGYVPFRREFNVTPYLIRLVEAGGRVALPVVVGPGRPLEFRSWAPGVKMALGVYDIPYPAEGEAVSPEALIVPMPGFDPAGYRLGYGAGYYDRTLATYDALPLRIGVSFELARLPTIHPQPHDIPMQLTLTEKGVFEPVR